MEAGLQDLHISRLKAHIRVISKEKKGFLGFGKKLAQVDIEGINEGTVYQADQEAVKGIPDDINRQNAPLVKPQGFVSPENQPEASDSGSSEIETVTTDEQDIPVDKAKAEITDSVEEALQEEELHEDFSQETSDVQVADQEASDNQAQAENQVAPSEISDKKAEDNSFEAFIASEFPEAAISKDIEKAADEVADYVTKIIYEMDIEATIDKSHNRRQINLQIDTQEAGRVIGYHGKVLKSLQLLAQNFLHDRYSKNFSVTLNVHDYVEHRTETLIDFTQKVANRVLDSGDNYTMDPMSNSERKIVHKTIAGIEGVESYSEGNDPNRYVVVSLQA
ncbi:RNA-binding cell elongation regulator Jag/EloR [Streptococcus penaeicida]|uniref:RNA-binding cell elongation regulator Jag/EloR n=1 Tax=Streptococcus penaeicida TaxID=1765960 RepID=UPI0039F0AA8B